MNNGTQVPMPNQASNVEAARECSKPEQIYNFLDSESNNLDNLIGRVEQILEILSGPRSLRQDEELVAGEKDTASGMLNSMLDKHQMNARKFDKLGGVVNEIESILG